MPGSAWSRWTALTLALVSSLASPGLAVAHGMAHGAAHGVRHAAQEQHGAAHGGGEDRGGHREHDYEHDREHDREHDHEPGPPSGAPALLPGDDTTVALHDARRTPGHHHPRVDAVPPGVSPLRALLDGPALPDAAPGVPPLAVHERAPHARAVQVALARPAPDTGPPPALRAPPIR